MLRLAMDALGRKHHLTHWVAVFHDQGLYGIVIIIEHDRLQACQLGDMTQHQTTAQPDIDMGFVRKRASTKYWKHLTVSPHAMTRHFF